MLMYHSDITFVNNTAHLTKIDGFKMVDDLHYLYGRRAMDLPLDVNRDWHPEIHTIYKQLLSGERELNPGTRISRDIYDFDFYVYEIEPIDNWEGYYHIFLEDLIQEQKWLNLVYHTFMILKKHSHWELDIRSGPFISMLPGNEKDFSHWTVLLKQDNNGDTFLVSRYNLEYISDSLVYCHLTDKKRQP